MKILMLSSYLPYPLFSGGHIRLYNIIRELSKRHDIVLVCERRSYQTRKDIEEVKKFCKEVVTIERKKQWSLSNILQTGFSTYPFLLVGHANPLLTEAIAKKLTESSFDLIHVETFYVMHNLPQVTLPIVLVEHNIEYLVYERYRKSAPFFLWPLLSIDIAKLKYWEERFWRKATKLIAVSEEEKKRMGREDVAVVPNGVDVETFKVRGERLDVRSERRILFIGDFTWIQNRDAVEWILKEIWPLIIRNWKLEIGNLKLWIVGRNIPYSMKRLSDNPNVLFDENAPKETSEIFQQADVLLAPIRVGGGTSFKILEAMASGVPVMTTLLGIAGIEARDGEEVLVADNADDLAKIVIAVLQDQELQAKLIKNARTLVEEKYDWKIIVKKLETTYMSVSAGNPEV